MRSGTLGRSTLTVVAAAMVVAADLACAVDSYSTAVAAGCNAGSCWQLPPVISQLSPVPRTEKERESFGGCYDQCHL